MWILTILKALVNEVDFQQHNFSHTKVKYKQQKPQELSVRILVLITKTEILWIQEVDDNINSQSYLKI